jgi:hypothetical protein
LAVEHVFVADHFEEGIAVGEGSGEGFLLAAEGFAGLRGVELGTDGIDLGLEIGEHAGKGLPHFALERRGVEVPGAQAVGTGEVA